MKEVMDIIFNYGVGVFCVGYLAYFQSITMKEMLSVLNNMNNRLAVIEDKLGIEEGK